MNPVDFDLRSDLSLLQTVFSVILLVAEDSHRDLTAPEDVVDEDRSEIVSHNVESKNEVRKQENHQKCFLREKIENLGTFLICVNWVGILLKLAIALPLCVCRIDYKQNSVSLCVKLIPLATMPSRSGAVDVHDVVGHLREGKGAESEASGGGHQMSCLFALKVYFR